MWRLTLLYVGVAFLVGSLWALALLVPVLVVMTYGVLKKEETHLGAQFGEAYREYKTAVRRWI